MDIYQAKQEWEEKIMASKLTPATKVFAFGVKKHAFGVKVQSNPGTERLAESTNLSDGHFSTYRDALVDCGALTITKNRAGKFKQEHCEYTLNLEWDGAIPPMGGAIPPAGESNTPYGESNAPRGGTNTTSNTSIEESKEVNNAPAGAVASSINILEIQSTSSIDVLDSPLDIPFEDSKGVPLQGNTPRWGTAIDSLTDDADLSHSLERTCEVPQSQSETKDDSGLFDDDFKIEWNPSPAKGDEGQTVALGLAYEIKGVVCRNAGQFKESGQEQFWQEVTALAIDRAFEPDISNAGSRVGKAQSRIANRKESAKQNEMESVEV